MQIAFYKSKCCSAYHDSFFASLLLRIYREVSLIGNALTCYGCSELIKPLVVVICEAIDSLTPPPTERSDQTEGETKVEPAVEAPSPIPPALTKLFLQDNSIDVHSPCQKGSFNSVLCTREIKKLANIDVVWKEVLSWFLNEQAYTVTNSKHP